MFQPIASEFMRSLTAAAAAGGVAAAVHINSEQFLIALIDPPIIFKLKIHFFSRLFSKPIYNANKHVVCADKKGSRRNSTCIDTFFLHNISVCKYLEQTKFYRNHKFFLRSLVRSFQINIGIQFTSN